MKKMLLFTLCCWLSALAAWAQSQQQITGTVTDETGSPLPGVTVSIQGARTGTHTNADGNFTIQVPGTGKVTLLFTFIGYKPFTLAAEGTKKWNIQLEKDITALKEVVIGYQSVPRKDLTGAVSTLDAAKQLRDVPANSAAEALTGRLAGVQVTTAEGMPGADAVINIRGRNSITQDGSPLYVVDGIQVDNALNTLSPQDIESVDVLKDAAATAIYGARGSNGVIIITTKGGKNTGGKTTVTYNAFMGVQSLANKLPVMDPYEFVLYQYERSKLTGDTSAVSQYIRFADNFDTIATYKQVPFIDWQEKTMNRKALTQTHNVSISGGNQTTQYNVSLTHNDQDGILLNSGYKRNLVNFKFDHKANSKLRFGFNTRYNQQEVVGAGTSDVGGAGSNRLKQYVRYKPLLLPDEPEDYYDANLATVTNGNGMALINPLQINDAEYRKKNLTVLNLNGYINYSITKHLSFRTIIGYDVNTTQTKNFDDTITNNAKNYRVGGLPAPLASVNNSVRTTINNANVLTYTNNALFTSKHSLSVIAGEETYQTKNKNNYLEVRYFPPGITADQAFANMNLAAAPAGQTQPKPTSSEIPVNNVSFFTRWNYAFNKKYLATFTFRSDGSSIFGDAHKWGYFPSGSLAWRISEELFMKRATFITDLKLRLSYGTAGNNRIDPFSYKTLYAGTAQYALNDAPATGYAPSRLGKEELKWETLISRNAGLDVSFFKDRLQLTIDGYYNTTKDLLVSVAIPTSSGYTAQYQNIGATLNKGIEVQLSAIVLQKQHFSWNANFNISFNKNKIQRLGQQQSFLWSSGWGFSTTGQDYIVKVGDEVGAMYGWINDGYYTVNDFTVTPYSNASYPLLTNLYTLNAGVPNVYPGVSSVIAQPGLSKFKDLNGDSVINDKDRTIIGHAQPKFFGGLSQQFTYRNFDMSIFINYSYGNQVLNANKLEFTSSYSINANLLSIMNDRWHNVDGEGNQVQRVVTGTVNGVSAQQVIGISPEQLGALNANAKYWMPVAGANGLNPQSFAVEDASFIRINNITLGYTLPTELLRRVKIASLRIYGTVNNVATITGYSGYDPEANTRRNTPMTPGVDYAAYPRSRTWLLGVNVSF